ncbi:hypothetical protein DYI37_15305 [Fulvimarina endophytica]|uniref:Uncharacterized protein n=1 Tax=Fulvimarina endophytica TaxID=2293836 RepID=A0A371X084_9HYPH|nr:hypothetical protein [Fulvimarina endophytica]RFC62605.1 hypothetical protein DYI37_15305 [Fulvimarina endophytica]
MASSIESSIRRALGAGRAQDAEFRLSVYEAAGRAVEKVLASGASPEVAERRRAELRDAIAAVEADHAGPAAGQDANAPSDPRTAGPRDSNAETSADPVSRSAPEAGPGAGVPSSPTAPRPTVSGVTRGAEGPESRPERRSGETASAAPGPASRPVPIPAPTPRVDAQEPGDGRSDAAPDLGAQSRDPKATGETILPEPVIDERARAEPRSQRQAERGEEPAPGLRSSAAGREPRAFAPPTPGAGRDDASFEESGRLDAVTPSKEPALSNDLGSSPADDRAGPSRGFDAGLIGGLTRRDSGVPADHTPPSAEDWRPGARRRPQEKRRTRRGGILLSALILFLIAFLVLAGIYLLAPFVMNAASEDAPRSAAEGEADAADAQPDRDWISVFSGRQIDRIATPNGGRVVTVDTPSGAPAVRIARPLGSQTGEIGFLVGPGVVSQLAGKEARAELVVGSPDGEERSFTVRCLFEGESRCGRQRFTVSQTSAPFVFALDMAGIGREGGEIAIDPAIGEGDDLLVYGLRLTPSGGA